MSHDPVKHPDHYRWHPVTKRFGIECKHITAHFPHHLGAAIKYIWRAGRKGDGNGVEDLRKAIEFLKCQIEELETPLIQFKVDAKPWPGGTRLTETAAIEDRETCGGFFP